MNDHREPPQRPAEQDPAQPERRGELAGLDYGMRVLSYLIGGVLVYGALGWVGDHYLGTHFLLPVGIVLGAAGGCYVIIRRYGQHPEETTGATGRRLTRTGRRRPSAWTSNRKKEGPR